MYIWISQLAVIVNTMEYKKDETVSKLSVKRSENYFRPTAGALHRKH